VMRSLKSVRKAAPKAKVRVAVANPAESEIGSQPRQRQRRTNKPGLGV
jgi:hypothetical protein